MDFYFNWFCIFCIFHCFPLLICTKHICLLFKTLYSDRFKKTIDFIQCATNSRKCAAKNHRGKEKTFMLIKCQHKRKNTFCRKTNKSFSLSNLINFAINFGIFFFDFGIKQLFSLQKSFFAIRIFFYNFVIDCVSVFFQFI